MNHTKPSKRWQFLPKIKGWQHHKGKTRVTFSENQQVYIESTKHQVPSRKKK